MLRRVRYCYIRGSCERVTRSVKWRDKAPSGLVRFFRAGDFATNGVLVAFTTRAIANRYTSMRQTLVNRRAAGPNRGNPCQMARRA